MMSPVGLEIVLTCLAKVLRHLHDHNTGHFDVKPSNVLLKWVHTRGVFNKANVVLGDFGLAKQFTNGLYIYIHTTHTYMHNQQRSYSHIVPNMHITGEYHGLWRGTKTFVCPEMEISVGARNGRMELKHGDRVDIFALGVTMKKVIPRRMRQTTTWDKNFFKLIEDMTDALPHNRPNAKMLIARISNLNHTVTPDRTIKHSKRARQMLEALVPVQLVPSSKKRTRKILRAAQQPHKKCVQQLREAAAPTPTPVPTTPVPTYVVTTTNTDSSLPPKVRYLHIYSSHSV